MRIFGLVIEIISYHMRHPVYYRLYEANGVMELRRPAFSNDHFVGRVLSNLVTPPNTTDSPKEHIFNTEGFWGPENSCLLIACELNYLAVVVLSSEQLFR